MFVPDSLTPTYFATEIFVLIPSFQELIDI